MPLHSTKIDQLRRKLALQRAENEIIVRIKNANGKIRMTEDAVLVALPGRRIKLTLEQYASVVKDCVDNDISYVAKRLTQCALKIG